MCIFCEDGQKKIREDAAGKYSTRVDYVDPWTIYGVKIYETGQMIPFCKPMKVHIETTFIKLRGHTVDFSFDWNKDKQSWKKVYRKRKVNT